VKDTTPPSHSPLQYDDPQRFRDYAHSINFFDDDDFSTDDMFANPPPLPELEIPSIIQQAEQLQRQAPQLQQEARNYPPARGTSLGKTESRPQKRVRVDTPQPGMEQGRGCAVEEKTDGESVRAQKRVRFDMPSADERNGGVNSVKESLEEDIMRPQPFTDERTLQGHGQGGEDSSFDDCAWSEDPVAAGDEEGEKVGDLKAPTGHGSSPVQECDQ
jgi:hypothetical protein